MLTIHELVKWAEEELKTRVEQERHDTDDYDLHDTINEIADSFVPVYTREILEVALSNFYLICENSTLWPAFWNSTPLNHLIANIYEYLRQELYERYSDYQTK